MSACPICLDQMTIMNSVKLRCGHVFHVSCVNILRKHECGQQCPICRKDLSYLKKKQLKKRSFLENMGSCCMCCVFRR